MLRQASDIGQLFGSVSARDIAAILTDGGFTVTRNQIALHAPIKTIGLHTVPVALHPEVEVTITINVARNADEAERQARGEDVTQRREEADEAEEAAARSRRLLREARGGRARSGQGRGREDRLSEVGRRRRRHRRQRNVEHDRRRSRSRRGRRGRRRRVAASSSRRRLADPRRVGCGTAGGARPAAPRLRLRPASPLLLAAQRAAGSLRRRRPCGCAAGLLRLFLLLGSWPGILRPPRPRPSWPPARFRPPPDRPPSRRSFPDRWCSAGAGSPPPGRSSPVPAGSCGRPSRSRRRSWRVPRVGELRSAPAGPAMPATARPATAPIRTIRPKPGHLSTSAMRRSA